MLTIYSNIEYNVPGDTYLAFDGATYYLVYTEIDSRTHEYVMTLYEETDMPAEHRTVIGEDAYADTGNGAVFMIDEFINIAVDTPSSGLAIAGPRRGRKRRCPYCLASSFH